MALTSEVGLRYSGFWPAALLLLPALPLYAQDLDPSAVHVPMDSALRLAQAVAADSFPELPAYLLYSIGPRALLGDPGGLHWQVRWQARAFPHRDWLVVRVYAADGRVATERVSERGVDTSTRAPQR